MRFQQLASPGWTCLLPRVQCAATFYDLVMPTQAEPGCAVDTPQKNKQLHQLHDETSNSHTLG